MTLRLVELAPAPRTPVPVREFAAHLRMSSGFAEDRSEDALLEMYLRSATATLEARLGFAFIARQFELRVSEWSRADAQVLPMAPAVGVEAIALVDVEGGRTELAVADYVCPPVAGRALVRRRDGGALPTIPTSGFGEVRFTAGFGASANDVPPDLRQAVLLQATSYYERRGEGELPSVSPTVLALVQPYRELRV